MKNRDLLDTYSTIDGADTTCTPNEIKNQVTRNTHTNVGTGVDISNKKLPESNKEIVDFKGELCFNTDKPYCGMLKLTDPSKMYKLGWKHTIELIVENHKYMISI